MAPNYSLYTIPLYWILALIPHAYAIGLIKKSNNNNFNNANPHSLTTTAEYQKTVPAKVFARYERAEAAHHNAMENAPFFVGAVVLGNWVGLEHGTMNFATGAVLLLRLVYTLLYIRIEKTQFSHARSAVWAAGVGVLMGLYIKAGNVVVGRG
ncbi:hypothetical protein B0J11DRAFT_526813 [Dendryphion nanum]|uniref:Uncharacterized protein n=1 Tax=Dendryphion nanum TaxID=256645 RepID=A0A9P9DYS8_9PLEO|nr:hypothetical protein B0J11DRAFT_526813 [Dendryphion nanum]